MPVYVRRVISLLRPEDGQAMADYSFIMALVAAVSLLALATIGVSVSGYVNDAAALFP